MSGCVSTTPTATIKCSGTRRRTGSKKLTGLLLPPVHNHTTLSDTDYLVGLLYFPLSIFQTQEEAVGVDDIQTATGGSPRADPARERNKG